MSESITESTKSTNNELTRAEIMRRYPRLTAHVICASLGYCTPSSAAAIVRDVKYGRLNYCEWIYACYNGDPRGAVQLAIRARHGHKGFMASYAQARALVNAAIEHNQEPMFASWM